MAEIHVLDKHTAELIAAGEVVERPSSVVKELTENAVDAGAQSVTVSIQNGGIKCIEVADNGCGIEAESIPTAFIRHATSKISTQEDLETIHTLGFRGEALASIASVAHIELLTKTQEDEYAYLYRISGGEEESIEPAARPVGTTITVRDLFYNTPARMKFLKKDTSEGNFVTDVMTQIALAHPEVSFKYIRDGKVHFQTPGDGRLMSAAYAALSRDFAKDLVEVDAQSGYYKVSGLVTPPKSSRASRAMQYFFINGRFVKNRTMMAALEAAYKGTVMQGKFPGCVLSIEMPPQLMDVNVHPAKTEVRFAREREVFDAVYQSVKEVLITPQSTQREFQFEHGTQEKAPLPPQENLQEDAEASPVGAIPAVQQPAASAPSFEVHAVAAKPVTNAAPMPGEVHAYNDMITTLFSESPVPYRTAKAPDIWVDEEDEASEQPENPQAREPEEKPEPAASVQEPVRPNIISENIDPHQIVLEPLREEMEHHPLRYIGEIFDTYIVTQRDDDLCLLDKHAAHERMIFEQLAATYGNVSSQMLLEPVTVQLSAEEKDAILQSSTTLQESGLEIDDFGGNSIIMRAVPADVVPEDIEDLVVELASHLVSNPRYTTSEKTEWVLHSVSCRAAIKAGDKTKAEDLMHLAEAVLDGKIPPFCPHGRPIVLKISKKELEKQFGRQG